MNWLTSKPIAHRGFHNGKEIPENSLAAFQLAIERKYPIELDVHILLDNTLAVFHDDNLKRMTGYNAIIEETDFKTINDLRLAETDYKIPTLSEVLELVNGEVPLLIEIKNSGKPGRTETFLRRELRSYRGEIAVQSFNPLSIEWFRNHAPEIPRGILSSNMRDTDLSAIKKYILRNMLFNKRCEPRFISYDLNDLPSRRVEKELKRRNIPLLAWTIRTPEERERALYYADNIIFEGNCFADSSTR